MYTNVYTFELVTYVLHNLIIYKLFINQIGFFIWMQIKSILVNIDVFVWKKRHLNCPLKSCLWPHGLNTECEFWRQMNNKMFLYFNQMGKSVRVDDIYWYPTL